MRRISLACLMALVLASVLIRAQGCSNCFVISYVDIPANGATVSQGGIYFAGWGFLCEQGLPADRVDVAYRGNDGYFHPVQMSGNYFQLFRPDVHDYFAPYCGGAVGYYTGWHVYPAVAIPTGTRDLAINVWRGPYYQQHIRTVTITE